MSSFTTRRTFLLNRAAWTLVGVALVYAIFGGADRSWPIIIGCAAVGALFWVLANSMEKKRERRARSFRDEQGNARPNKL